MTLTAFMNMKEVMNMNSRTILMLGEDKVLKYCHKRIAIFGVGGVGGYVLESLVRSGFLNIDIYDFDVIDESNLNRQVISNTLNIGKIKVDVAKERALQINPNLNINSYNMFVDSKNVNEIDFTRYDFVVDAIDTVDSKMLIIHKCQEHNIKIISSMGTGNKLDPTKLLITDITKTDYCPLAKVIRKKCREENIKHLTVLVSKEMPIKTNTRNPGSMIFVPASAGLLISSYILRTFIEGDENESF